MKKILLLLGIGLSISKLYSQSANAIADVHNADTNVSYYTGTVHTSIPLYNAKHFDLNVPISVDYVSGNGVKLEQEASSVGLGWSLNAGGIITREIRGIDDLREFDYDNNPHLKSGYAYRGENHFPEYKEDNTPVTPVNFSEDDHRAYVDILEGRSDGEPDIFTFNFLGISGRFFYKNGSSSPVLISQTPGLKISKSWGNQDGFDITDSNGTVYTFLALERTYNITLMGTFPYFGLYEKIGEDLETGFIKSAIVEENDNSYISAWRLSRISPQKGNDIVFEYSYSKTVYSWPYQVNNHAPTVNEANDNHTFISTKLPERYDDYETSAVNIAKSLDYYGNTSSGYYAVLQKTNIARLTAINFVNGKVVFNYGNVRKDLSLPGKYFSINANYDTYSTLNINGTSAFEQKWSKRFKDKYESGALSDSYFISNPETKTDSKLESISIYNNDDKLIKGYHFYQSYNIDENELSLSPAYLRMYLDSIAPFYEHKTLTKKPYRFFYELEKKPWEINYLEAKNSSSHDYWGYQSAKAIKKESVENPFFDLSNHSGNTYLIKEELDVVDNGKPRVYSRFPLHISRESDKYTYLNGVNREPDTSTVQVGILKKIQYPNGSKTKFTYEINEYSSSKQLYNYKENTIYKNNESVKNFSLTHKTLTSFKLKFYDAVDQVGDVTIGYKFLLKRNGINFMEVYPEYVTDYGIEDPTYTFNVLLPNGDFTFEVIKNTTENSTASFEIKYYTLEETQNKQGPGVRIQSIEKTDAKEEKTYFKTVFSYNDESGVSTGKLLLPNSYGYNKDLIGKSYQLSNNLNDSDWVYGSDEIIRSENNVHQLSGTLLGYSTVTVKSIDSLGNNMGKTVYNYSNNAEKPIVNFIPNVPHYINSDNGKLLKKQVFNSDNIKVSEDSYEYVTEEDFSISTKALVVYDLRAYDDLPQKSYKHFYPSYYSYDPEDVYTDISQNDYEKKFYDITSKWSYLKSKSSTVYDLQGENPHTTFTEYFYNKENDYQFQHIDKTVTWSNKSTDTLKTKFTYDNNYHVRIVKKENFRNNNLLTSEDIEYDLAHTRSPARIKTSAGKYSGVKEMQDVQFLDYSNYGKIGYTLRNNEIYTYYIWGYGEQYLLAEITTTGAPIDWDALQDLINDAKTASSLDDDNCSEPECKEQQLRNVLDAIRNHPVLENALMTSFTYNPLEGKTSQTDVRGETVYFKNDLEKQVIYTLNSDGNVISQKFINQSNK